MRAGLAVSVLVLSGVLQAAPSMAQNYSSPWIFSVNVGAEVPSSGNVIAGVASNTVVLSTLNTNLVGSGSVVMRGRTFDDLYDPALTASFEVRYALSDLTEVFGSLGYKAANAKNGVDLGCIQQSTAPGVCYQALSGEVSDLKQYALEIGYRQWFGTGLLSSAVKPYWAVHGGAVYTDAVNASITSPLGGIANWSLYDSGTSLTAGADLGASYTLTQNFEIAAEVGVRYTDNLNDNDADIGGIGLETANDKSRAVSFPISVRMHTVF